VIRIRYSSELQPGLNGKAVRIGRTTFVYLLPGLTPAQRAATLRRLRQHGRMGLSPRLPAVPLSAAVLQDRVGTAFGQTRAIVRTHPAASTVPVIIVSAAVIGFLLASAVSIKIIHTPLATGSGAIGAAHASTPAPSAGATGQHGTGPASRSPGRNGPGTPTGNTGSTGITGSTRSAVSTSPSTSVGTPLTSSAATSPPTQPGTTATTGTSTGIPNPGTPSPSASPSPSGSPPAVAGTTVCVRLGPFGICL
jgi:hypothetical protein